MQRREAGFSLVEVLVGLMLIGFVVLSAAPLFVQAAKVNAAGGDMGSCSALAEERMELLRKRTFNALPAGGSLTGDVAGYVDSSVDGFVVRWMITDGAGGGGSKLIEVRALALGESLGRRQVDLVALRSR